MLYQFFIQSLCFTKIIKCLFCHSIGTVFTILPPVDRGKAHLKLSCQLFLTHIQLTSDFFNHLSKFHFIHLQLVTLYYNKCYNTCPHEFENYSKEKSTDITPVDSHLLFNFLCPYISHPKAKSYNYFIF